MFSAFLFKTFTFLCGTLYVSRVMLITAYDGKGVIVMIRHVCLFCFSEGQYHFSCFYCSKAFLTSYALRVHLRSHTQERPYCCCFPNCRKAFNTLYRFVLNFMFLHCLAAYAAKSSLCCYCFLLDFFVFIVNVSFLFVLQFVLCICLCIFCWLSRVFGCRYQSN